MTGDDRRIVEWVDEMQALHVADALHLGEGLADMRAMQHDPGTVGEARLDFRTAGTDRHDHGDSDLGRSARPGVGLACVAGRQRDHSTGPLLVAQRGDPVGHAAGLE